MSGLGKEERLCKTLGRPRRRGRRRRKRERPHVCEVSDRWEREGGENDETILAEISINPS